MTRSIEPFNLNAEMSTALPEIRECFFSFLVATALNNEEVADTFLLDAGIAVGHALSGAKFTDDALSLGITLGSILTSDREWISKRAEACLRRSYKSNSAVTFEQTETFLKAIRDVSFEAGIAIDEQASAV